MQTINKINISTTYYILLIIYLSTTSIFAENILTWRDCVRITQKNNPELASAAENIKMSEANIGIARSPMLPNVEANSSVSKSKSETQFGPVEQDSYSYGIEGRQMLFDGLKTFSDVDKSKEDLKISRYRYQAVSSNVRLGLRNAYISIMKAQENIEISKKIEKRRKQNYDLVKLRYEAGREHKGSLLTAEADYAQAVYEVKQAERDIELAREELRKIMGTRSMPELKVEQNFSLSEKHDSDPDIKMITDRNPLLNEMVHQYESAKFNTKSSKRNFFPKVYGFLGAGRSNNEWPPDKTEWNAGVQATMPLFEGGRRIYETKRAIAGEKYYKAELKRIEDSILFTLQQKWIEFKNAVDNISVREKYLKAAEERSLIVEAQYTIGLVSFDNWIIIENTLVQAMKNYNNARANALVAEARWIQAKGETLEYDKE